MGHHQGPPRPSPAPARTSLGKLRVSASGIPEPRAASVEFEMLYNLLSELQAPGEKGHTLGPLDALESAFLSSFSPHGEGPAPVLQRRRTEAQGDS